MKLKQLRKSFTIYLSRWSRAEGLKPIGHSEVDQALLTGEGRYCCLGFYCQQVFGVPDNKLLDAPLPSSVGIKSLMTTKAKYIGELLTEEEYDRLKGPANIQSILASINDEGSIPRKRKKEIITKIFQKVGIKVTFKK